MVYPRDYFLLYRHTIDDNITIDAERFIITSVDNPKDNPIGVNQFLREGSQYNQIVQLGFFMKKMISTQE